MVRPRFSIGIDLGTTNCALAFVPLDDETRSEIFGIPQWDTLSAIVESPALPSFLYLPDEAAAAQIQKRKDRQRGVGCRPARTQKGSRIARPGRPFGEVLALPPYIRSLGAISALGIGRHCPQQQDIAGMRLGADPQSSQENVEHPVCRGRRRLRV